MLSIWSYLGEGCPRQQQREDVVGVQLDEAGVASALGLGLGGGEARQQRRQAEQREHLQWKTTFPHNV